MASSSFPSSSSSSKRKRERPYWTKDESRILREYLEKQEWKETWEQVAISTGLSEKGRSGNSCREHWFNQLRPGIEKGSFTAEEEAKIIHLHKKYNGGKKKWSKIAAHLPGRTRNQVKNHWNTKLSKGVDVEVGEQLVLECTNAIDYNQLSELEFSPSKLDDVEVGEQLVLEYTNAVDYNQLSELEFSPSELDVVGFCSSFPWEN